MKLGDALVLLMGTYYEGFEATDAPEMVPGIIEDKISSMVGAGLVKEITVGDRTVGIPKVPYINLAFGDITQDEAHSSIGNTEIWNIGIYVKSVVQDVKSPARGLKDAIDNLSSVKSFIFEDRSLGQPQTIRNCEVSKFFVVPNSMYLSPKKKDTKTYYGASMLLTFTIKVEN